LFYAAGTGIEEPAARDMFENTSRQPPHRERRASASRHPILWAILASLWASGAIAESPGFYAGRSLSILVGASPGGYYDAAARVVARHLVQCIPGNPAIVVQDQPGAGGLATGNRLSTTIERDGRTILAMNRSVPQLALTGDPNAAFDPLQLTWLGSLSSYQDDAYLMVVNARHPAKSLDDLRGPGKPLHLGGTRAGATNIIFALLARDLLNLNVELTKGYPGANEIWLAMDRDEVDGQMVDVSAIMVGRPRLWAEHKLRPLVAFGRTQRLPDLPDVPIARELIADPSDLALLEFAELPFFMALPFVAPPGIPGDRARILKDAFMAMAMNEAFRADMRKVGILTSPIDGDAVRALVEKAAKTPADVRTRFVKLLADK
jgi:tripartite-type tricarboxylate transporter receptor subunit TctC